MKNNLGIGAVFFDFTSKQFKAILFKIRVENVKDKDLLTYIGIQIDWGKITLGALHSVGSQS